jgi:cytochrome b
MLLGIEFKRAKMEGRTWYMVAPVVEGTQRQKNTTGALIVIALFTLLTFTVAGMVLPDPLIKPDNTAVVWGGK